MLRNALHGIRRDDDGFTPIELLIVIVLLGVLAAIMAFSVRGIVERGAVSAGKAEAASFSAPSPASR
jgi:general secretion pathway protein G